MFFFCSPCGGAFEFIIITCIVHGVYFFLQTFYNFRFALVFLCWCLYLCTKATNALNLIKYTFIVYGSEWSFSVQCYGVRSTLSHHKKKSHRKKNQPICERARAHIVSHMHTYTTYNTMHTRSTNMSLCLSACCILIFVRKYVQSKTAEWMLYNDAEKERKTTTYANTGWCTDWCMNKMKKIIHLYRRFRVHSL